MTNKEREISVIFREYLSGRSNNDQERDTHIYCGVDGDDGVRLLCSRDHCPESRQSLIDVILVMLTVRIRYCVLQLVNEMWRRICN